MRAADGFCTSAWQRDWPGLVARSSGWGLGFHDFDNDGWKDLFVAQSHVLDNVERMNSVVAVPGASGAVSQRGRQVREGGSGAAAERGGTRRGVRGLEQRRNDRCGDGRARRAADGAARAAWGESLVDAEADGCGKQSGRAGGAGAGWQAVGIRDDVGQLSFGERQPGALRIGRREQRHGRNTSGRAGRNRFWKTRWRTGSLRSRNRNDRGGGSAGWPFR